MLSLPLSALGSRLVALVAIRVIPSLFLIYDLLHPDATHNFFQHVISIMTSATMGEDGQDLRNLLNSLNFTGAAICASCVIFVELQLSQHLKFDHGDRVLLLLNVDTRS